jgi:hypothetical protein
MTTKREPIRIGDKFRDTLGTWEVIETRPGGHVSLFDRARSMFVDLYACEVREMQRIAA